MRLIGITRRARVFGTVFITVSITVAVASLAIGQASTVAEDDDGGSTAFTVAGDGSLTTKRPSLRGARDPLSTEEVGYSIGIAVADPSIPRGATNVRGEAGAQVLYVDIPDSNVDAGGRKALVVLYDYTGDRAYHQVVDLKAGTVTRSRSATGLQPPTAPDEADVAIALALDAATRPRFVAAFEQAEGVPLVSPQQIHYVAGVWSYDGTSTGGKECGAERCAQLMVSTSSGAYLDTTDFVVNLSSGKTVTLEQR